MQVDERNRSCAHCKIQINQADSLASGRSMICVGCSAFYHKNCADLYTTNAVNVFTCCFQEDVDLIMYNVRKDPLISDTENVKSYLSKIYNMNLNTTLVRRFAVLSPALVDLPLIVRFSCNQELEVVWRRKQHLDVWISRVQKVTKFDPDAHYLKHKATYDSLFGKDARKFVSLIPKKTSLPEIIAGVTAYP